MTEIAKSEKMLLIQLARSAIEGYLSKGNTEFQTTGQASLQQPGGAFVSLHAGGELRGCIGRIQSNEPLERVIQEMAIAAATQDNRFLPVNLAEVQTLDIEISVLSPFQPLQSLDEIQVGIHGLMVRQGLQSGLLLPQVASEQGWDRVTFLGHTCLKAGLHPEAWQTGEVQIEIFSAEVFSEKSLSSP